MFESRGNEHEKCGQNETYHVHQDQCFIRKDALRGQVIIDPSEPRQGHAQSESQDDHCHHRNDVNLAYNYRLFYHKDDSPGHEECVHRKVHQTAEDMVTSSSFLNLFRLETEDEWNE